MVILAAMLTAAVVYADNIKVLEENNNLVVKDSNDNLLATFEDAGPTGNLKVTGQVYEDGATRAGSFEVGADAGTAETVNTGDTLTVSGGTDISTSVGAPDTVTINADGALTRDEEWNSRDEVEAAWQGTTTIWCNDNDGAGSTLDADTLDGTEAAGFQAADEGLTNIAGLAVADGNVIVGDGANWVAESGSTAQASLGLTIGSDVQGWDADLDDLADRTLTGDFVNTANPWADNEVADALTVTGYMQDEDVNTFAELQAWVSDKTLINTADAADISGVWEIQDNTRLNFGDDADVGLESVSAGELVVVDAADNTLASFTDAGSWGDFEVTGIGSFGEELASGGVGLEIKRDAGGVNFGRGWGGYLKNDADEWVHYGITSFQIETNTDGAEDGYFSVGLIADGVMPHYTLRQLRLYSNGDGHFSGDVHAGGDGDFVGEIHADGADLDGPLTLAVANFDVDEAAQSVSGANIFKVTDGWGPNETITSLTNGQTGQQITIIGGDSDCTVVDDNDDLDLSANWVAHAKDTLVLVCDGSTWYELSRSDN